MHKLLILLAGLLMFNCMSQKSEKDTKEAVSNSQKIRELLNEKRFAVLENMETVVRFNLSKELIEGTKNEYYNKLTIKDTLSTKAMKLLLKTLENDDSYNWEAPTEKQDFNPNQQFLVKSKDGQLTVLLDDKGKLLAYTDLYGQEIIAINSRFRLLLEAD